MLLDTHDVVKPDYGSATVICYTCQGKIFEDEDAHQQYVLNFGS
jgi:hypothetical protein